MRPLLRIIADDLTGACDVGGEFAAAGHDVAVIVHPEGERGGEGRLRVLNTQSRGLAPEAAHARVLAAVRREPVEVLFKKIDTALRGHLGAELDAAVTGLGGATAFVLPAIPGAGRVTRHGCQWFDGRPLAATEFADDPEGPGGESSIAAVLARETARPSAVLSVAEVRAGALDVRARELQRAGVALVVVDCERERDVALAVDAILALPRPVCIAGSVPVARALAGRRDLRTGPRAIARRRRPTARLASPVLAVSGSLHSRAREQLAVLERAARAVRLAMDGGDDPVGAACAALEAGRNVIIAAAPPPATPSPTELRATERRMGELVARIVSRSRVRVASLVLIGGQTSYEVLRRLGADEIRVLGSPAPLLASGEIVAGIATGMALLTKGGSGGSADALARLVTVTAPHQPRPRTAARRG